MAGNFPGWLFMRFLPTGSNKKKLALLMAALDATEDGILIINMKGKVVYYNQKFVNIWKIPQSLLDNGNNRLMIQYAANQLTDPEAFTTKTLSFAANPEIELTDELFFKDGKIFERSVKPQKIKDKIIGRVISFRDITERKNQDNKLLKEALHDPLTGLPNRKLLMETLHQSIGYANRTNLSFALLFLDLDHYKVVNDSFGHTLGDVLLREVAVRLQQCVRENDLVVRVGGDEFVVVATTLQKKQDVIPVAEKIISRLSEPFLCEGQELKITVSIGISFYFLGEQTPEILLKEADEAMYRAKRLGRNNFQFYEYVEG